jgi:hypothetical protein
MIRLHHKSLGYLSPIKYQQMKTSALSTPASGNPSLIAALPVVDKAVQNEKNITFENSN